MDITKNGVPAAPAAMVTTSWVRDDFANGRRRFSVYAMHLQLMQAVSPEKLIAGGNPRIAGAPTVIGQTTLDVPNLEVLRILHAAIGEMLAKQGPEIVQVG